MSGDQLGKECNGRQSKSEGGTTKETWTITQENRCEGTQRNYTLVSQYIFNTNVLTHSQKFLQQQGFLGKSFKIKASQKL